MSQRSKPSPFALTALLAMASSSAAYADCAGLRGAFDAAIASRSAAAVIQAYENVEASNVCDFDTHAYNQRAIETVIGSFSALTSQTQRDQTLKWLEARIPVNGDWKSAQWLGGYLESIGDRVGAQRGFELALTRHTPNPVGDKDRAELKALAEHAFVEKSLASNDDEGRTSAELSKSLRGPDGSVSGLYSVLTRTVEIGRLPVPINFIFDSTEMTPAGKQAVKELAEAVMDQEIASFKLIGHADPRGGAGYNVTLSVLRAEAVAKAVEAEISADPHNYLGSHKMPSIATDGKGAAEPYDVSFLPSPPSQEEAWQLDRRVEFEFLDK